MLKNFLCIFILLFSTGCAKKPKTTTEIIKEKASDKYDDTKEWVSDRYNDMKDKIFD